MDALLFHPKLVHVPIALALLMPLVSFALTLAWWRRWLPGRAWILAIGLQAILLGSGVVALRSGEQEEERVERIVAERFIEQHEEAGQAFVWAGAGVLALMLVAGLLGSRRPGLPIAALASAGTALVLVLGIRVGQAGGELVYRHGAAQAYTSTATAGEENAGAGSVMAEDDD